MEQVLVGVWLGMFGLVAGSFSGATVWRLRARQLKEDKAEGEKVRASEYRQLKELLGKSFATDRSVCLHCHHQLRWYDLIPLVSWLSLGGKCRYCRKPIGSMEPLIELGTAFFFVMSYIFWPSSLAVPLDFIEFGLWLLIGVGLVILFVYDLRWYLLPDRIMFPLLGVAGAVGILNVFQADDKIAGMTDLVLACGVLSGIYYILHLVSKGAWIGWGDIKLGLVLALVIGQWPQAFLVLFLANLIGCIIVLPGLLLGKLTRTSQVPFGPLLILAYFIVGLFGQAMLAWYLGGMSLQ